MANTPKGYTVKQANPGGQQPLPISKHFGPGVQTIPGTSILQRENLNKGQSDRSVARNATASTNQRQVPRPNIPSAYSN
jgi:hypothetical protein